MILSYFILPGLIYLLAFFFWSRYLYNHSLKKAADRIYLLEKVSALVVYIPIGLQAILLFCFSLLQVIPLGDELAGLFKFAFLKNAGKNIPDFYAFDIILAGSLLVTGNCCLIVKASLLKSTVIKVVCKSLVFAAGIFFLNVLRLNISYSFFGNTGSRLIISYNGIYVLVLTLSAVVFFALLKSTWMYKKQSRLIKYFSLTSRILLLYSFLVAMAAIPVIIYQVIKR
jgi:hypothetical protein